MSRANWATLPTPHPGDHVRRAAEARRAKREQWRSGFPGDEPTSRLSIGFTDQPPSIRTECLGAECSCPATEYMSKSARVSARAAEYKEPSQKEESKWYEMPCGEDYDALAQAFVASVDATYGPHLEDSPLLATQHDVYAAMNAMVPDLVDDHVCPKTIKSALSGADADKWAPSIKKEIDTLCDMRTWRPATLEEKMRYTRIGNQTKRLTKFAREIIMIKLVMAIKSEKDGTVASYKSRAVARGDLTLEGVHYDDTFCGVPRFDTIRFFFCIAIHLNRTVYQFDCVSAFVQADLKQPLPCRLPDDVYDYMKRIGVTESQIGRKGDILMMLKSLYGLGDAGYMWQQLFEKNAATIGFVCEKQVDACLFTLKIPGSSMNMILYVDDGLCHSSDDARGDLVIRDLLIVVARSR